MLAVYIYIFRICDTDHLSSLITFFESEKRSTADDYLTNPVPISLNVSSSKNRGIETALHPVIPASFHYIWRVFSWLQHWRFYTYLIIGYLVILFLFKLNIFALPNHLNALLLLILCPVSLVFVAAEFTRADRRLLRMLIRRFDFWFVLLR